MNFFEHQAAARRNTRRLVLLYALAVVGVVIAVDLVIAAAWVWGSGEFAPRSALKASLVAQIKAVPGQLYLLGALATVGVILAVSLFHVIRLASGGEVIAKMVGARRVPPDTRDPLERRLVNVVEEMAIASGVRVPVVYVMDGEEGINAFAAGYDVSNSVVAVTRGTLGTLNRDELQGVVGHEFSHILNGDMRLNIRMIGVLAGIVFIGSIGEFLMRSVSESRGRKEAAHAGIFSIGLALLIIGYVGLFFARLIKAAVSRQREFLADASSVQFTRNPDGIAGALDQIRGAAGGTLIANRYAEDLSHMFFGQSVRMWFGGLFATHPPVEERIKRAHPRFQAADYRKGRAQAAAQPEAGREDDSARRDAAIGVLTAATMLPAAGRRGVDQGAAWGRSAGESAQLVGTMEGGKVSVAARLLAALPAELRQRLHEREGARAALVALLLAPKDDVMRGQLDALKAAGLGALGAAAAKLVPLTRRLGPAFHLPVIDLALPAVKGADAAAQAEVVRALEAVIHADRRVSLQEFVVLTLVRNQLAPKTRPGAAGNKTIAELRDQAATVLALVAHAGTRADAAGERQQQVQKAMLTGAQVLGIPASAPAAAPLTLDAANAALEALKALGPMQKGVLVKGLFAAVTADGSIRVMEAALMRLVGAVLDCPLPPLLEEIDPATLA